MKKVRRKGRTQRPVASKLKGLADAWVTHVRDEIQIHKVFLKGQRSLKQHLKDTKRIHQKFLKKIRRL